MAAAYRHEDFDVQILPRDRSSHVNVREIWEYRDLIFLLVRRDFVANYKQTVLGPAWAIVQPVLATLIYAAVFGDLAGLSPTGVPAFLFYMCSQVMWGYFSSCVTVTSSTFISNQALMSKVYFPRFVAPIASAISRSINLLIQTIMFALFCVAFTIMGNPPTPNLTVLLIPLYLLHLGLLALGVGALLSALTTKYRDIVILTTYAIQLWMYLTPVVYDISVIPEHLQFLYLLNPVSPILVQVRYALFSQGAPVWGPYLISVVVTGVLLVVGYRAFCWVERTFVDTI